MHITLGSHLLSVEEVGGRTYIMGVRSDKTATDGPLKPARSGRARTTKQTPHCQGFHVANQVALYQGKAGATPPYLCFVDVAYRNGCTRIRGSSSGGVPKGVFWARSASSVGARGGRLKFLRPRRAQRNSSARLKRRLRICEARNTRRTDSIRG